MPYIAARSTRLKRKPKSRTHYTVQGTCRTGGRPLATLPSVLRLPENTLKNGYEDVINNITAITPELHFHLLIFITYLPLFLSFFSLPLFLPPQKLQVLYCLLYHFQSFLGHLGRKLDGNIFLPS